MIKINNIDYPNNHNLLELARIGNSDNFCICVYGKEERIPHFHIYRGNSPDDYIEKGCIKILSSEYFNHNKSDNIRLSNKEKRELVDFLKDNTKSKLLSGSHWDFIIYELNINNPDNTVSEDINMPTICLFDIDYISLSHRDISVIADYISATDTPFGLIF